MAEATLRAASAAAVGRSASRDQSNPRGHLYEVDVIRSVTALSVVGVHVVAFTIILTRTTSGELVQDGVVSILHFTREIFVAITAFVMVYGYAHRHFSGTAFWRKRALGVLLPYIAWSVLYELVQGPRLPPSAWMLHLVADLLTGSASFQLYYIVLTLEFYLIFPWFLRWIQRAGRRPWLLLGISFAVQLVLTFVDYRYVQVGKFSGTPLGSYIKLNQARFLPFYQFYVVVGGVAGLYLEEIRAFLLRYGRWSLVAVALTAALLLGNMVYQVVVLHQSLGDAISVFQPAMQFYVLALTVSLYWASYRWAISRSPRAPAGYGFWRLMSDASFGMYLVQGFFLSLAMSDLVPSLPLQWYEPLRVVVVFLVVAAVIVSVCSITLYIPGLSRLIGHPCRLQPRRQPGESGSHRPLSQPAWLGAVGRAVVGVPQLVGIQGRLPLAALTWSESPREKATSYVTRRKLVLLLGGLLGLIMLLASCATTSVYIKPASRLVATPVEHRDDRAAAPVAEKQATVTATAVATPGQLPTVVGSISCPPLTDAGASSMYGFLSCAYDGGFDHRMSVYLHVPNNYDPSKSYPTVLVLHGGEEAYDPTQSQAANEANLLSQEYVDVWGPGYPVGSPSVQSNWPCFVIVPQLVGANRWADVPADATSFDLTPQPSLSMQMAIDSTLLLERRYSSMDNRRLYITGISMGAYGVWDAIERWPSLFAAAVPVSGAGDPSLANRIVALPIWDFHGADDDVIPVAGSQLMIQALQASGGKPCYTQYPDQLHDIWDLVYGYADNRSNPLYPWLFSQVKSSQAVAYSCS